MRKRALFKLKNFQNNLGGQKPDECVEKVVFFNLGNSKEFRTHSCETLTYLKKFAEAVLKYTGAEKIDVISHSMGVTVARKVVIGGMFFDENGKKIELSHLLRYDMPFGAYSN